jgi:acetyltransferase-like isoleucine patch superfamily enzyme
MGIGIRKTIFAISSLKRALQFESRKIIFGFEAANRTISTLDKVTLMKILKRNGAQIGNDCDIESGLTFHNCQDYSNLIIGDNIHIGKNCFFDLAAEIEFGNNVVVSMCTNFITHINMKKSELSSLFPGNAGKICIGKNTYIGAGTNILMGIELGENCFVAAGSVVTKSFDSNSFIAGVPAVLKRMITK